MKLLFSLLLMALPVCAIADTLYFCKAYSGGTFWASAHCSKHRALIDSIHDVPSGLPFDQQVNIGQQQLNQSAALARPAGTTHRSSPVPNPRAVCPALKARIVQLDSMARQPQTGQMQDWISAEKAKVRSRQFQLHC